MITTHDPRDLYRCSVAAEVFPRPEAIDDTHVAAYRRDGFLAVANLLSTEEMATAEAALTDLIHGRVPGFDGVQPEAEYRDRWAAMSPVEREPHVRKLWLFVEHEPRLAALSSHAAIHTVLDRLIGERCRMIQDMALLKPAFVGGEKPWHQDMAYFGFSPPEKLIGVWIAVDPATAENGCMHVIPGTHRSGPVPHVHARDCQIADERVAVERQVMVPLAPGDALFFSALLHHGTPHNTSPARRWAVQFHYAGESTVPIDRDQHATLYFDGDRYAGCRGGNGTAIRRSEG